MVIRGNGSGAIMLLVGLFEIAVLLRGGAVAVGITRSVDVDMSAPRILLLARDLRFLRGL